MDHSESPIILRLKKATTELLLISLLDEEDMYGYQLASEIKQRSHELCACWPLIKGSFTYTDMKGIWTMFPMQWFFWAIQQNVLGFQKHCGSLFQQMQHYPRRKSWDFIPNAGRLNCFSDKARKNLVWINISCVPKKESNDTGWLCHLSIICVALAKERIVLLMKAMPTCNSSWKQNIWRICFRQ